MEYYTSMMRLFGFGSSQEVDAIKPIASRLNRARWFRNRFGAVRYRPNIHARLMDLCLRLRKDREARRGAEKLIKPVFV